MDSSFNLAVHALVCLSHSGRSLGGEALAENICTNPTRVRRVLAGLKKAGDGGTREGLDGGYRLCTDPAALSLRQVAEAINTRFVDCAWHSGDIDPGLRHLFRYGGRDGRAVPADETSSAPPSSRILRSRILKHNSFCALRSPLWRIGKCG